MLQRGDHTFCDSPKPSSFAALMELYEANYIRLRRLCGALSSVPDSAVSRAPGALDLHLMIQERSAYTTTLFLTYLLPDAEGTPRPNPNLLLRVYHDARQVEALSRDLDLHRHPMSRGRRRTETALERKWRLNRFLYKWLGYCAHQGHGTWSADRLPTLDRHSVSTVFLVD